MTDAAPGAAARAARHRAASCARCPPARPRRRRRSSSGPATTAPTRSPGTTGWSTSPTDYADRGVRFLAVNSNDAERYPADGPEAMRERFEREGWPFPYLHDAGQEAAARLGRAHDPAPVRARPRAADRLRGRARRRPPGPGPAGASGCARRSTRSSRATSRRRAPSRSAARSSGSSDRDDRAAPLVRVPASSANLGPGYDVLAAALQLELELEVTETGEFSVEAGAGAADRPLEPLRARLRAPAPGRRPALRDPQRDPARPRPRLERRRDRRRPGRRRPHVRARHERDAIYRHAVELEGHPDNVAAALYGGFVLCPRPSTAQRAPAPVRIEPPEGVEAVLVIPDDTVPTAEARTALPAAISVDRRRRQRRRGDPARARARALRPRP